MITELALKYPMWGHRKIAWLARQEHGLQVAEATCLRILREAGLVLPIDDARERRNHAGARREAFLKPPTRRNRVWQMDFFELETAGGGTWRSGDVVDYWAKLVLAGPVTATQTHRDAIASVLKAIDEGRTPPRPATDPGPHRPEHGRDHADLPRLRQRPLLQKFGVRAVIASRPELTHIRTRNKSPQTNGVIERYHGAIKIEQLWRDLPADGIQMTTMVDSFRRLYNEVRPHEALDGKRPRDRYLADPPR